MNANWQDAFQSPRLRVLVALLGLALLAGCQSPSGGGDSGTSPAAVTPLDSSAVKTTVIPPGETCPAGGVQIDSGIDTNGNGVLDPDEVQNTQVVCNGASGTGVAALVKISPEPAGGNCAFGGQRIDLGLDNGDGGGTAGDGILQPGEYDLAPQYVCNGASTGENEGSIDMPVALTPWQTRHATVAAAGASYYKFTAVQGGTHLIRLAHTESDLGWTLYSDAGFTNPLGVCNAHSGSQQGEECAVSGLAAGATYYLKVAENANLPDLFELLVSYDLLIGADASGKLYRIDPATGGATLLSDTGLGELSALAYAPEAGVLYGGTGSTADCPNCFYAIDPLSGASEPFLVQGDLVSGMAARPWDDRLYAVLETECTALQTVDPQTGALSVVVRAAFPSCYWGGYGMTFDGSGALLMADAYSPKEIYLMGQEADAATRLGTYSYTGFPAPGSEGKITAMATRPSDGTLFVLTDAGHLGTLVADNAFNLVASYVGTPSPALKSLEAMSRIAAAPYPPVRDFYALYDGLYSETDLWWREYPLATWFDIYWGDSIGIDPADPATYVDSRTGVTGTSLMLPGLGPPQGQYFLIVPVIRGVTGPSMLIEVDLGPT